MAQKCFIESCNRANQAWGMCSMHYLRMRNNGSLDSRSIDPQGADKKCEVEDCALSSNGKARYCGYHDARNKKYGHPTEGAKQRERLPAGVYPEHCPFPDCQNKHNGAYIFCKSHRARFKKYGVNDQQILELLNKSGGLCDLCGNEATIHIDHDHACCPELPACGNCVRGLLCRRCNYGIGQFNDDVELLNKAADYLKAA